MARVFLFFAALSLFVAFLMASTGLAAAYLMPVAVLGGFFFVTAHLFP